MRESSFWSKVGICAKESCWEWTGARNAKRRSGRICRPGYGTVKVRGRMRPAHRIAWELFNRASILPGYVACHSCDNPGCVNPHHIWLGTPSENTLDALRKGRLKSLPPGGGK